MYVVVVRDIKADAFSVPMFVQSIGGAVRAFGDEIQKDDKNPMAMHPEDYELYHIGSFDELRCKFDLIDPVQLAVGSNYKGSR